MSLPLTDTGKVEGLLDNRQATFKDLSNSEGSRSWKEQKIALAA